MMQGNRPGTLGGELHGTKLAVSVGIVIEVLAFSGSDHCFNIVGDCTGRFETIQTFRWIL